MDEIKIEGRAGRGSDTPNDVVHVIPVVQETATVQKSVRESGSIAIHKTVHERTEVVDQPHSWEEVVVERVPVNRVVDAPIPVRYEGDTMIVSLIEEVAVVEKRLLLREEVHIRKLLKEEHEAKEVQLREERVEIVRNEGADDASRHDEARS